MTCDYGNLVHRKVLFLLHYQMPCIWYTRQPRLQEMKLKNNWKILMFCTHISTTLNYNFWHQLHSKAFNCVKPKQFQFLFQFQFSQNQVCLWQVSTKVELNKTDILTKLLSIWNFNHDLIGWSFVRLV